MREYEIRDIPLAPSGHQKSGGGKNNMPLLRGLEEEFVKTKPFEGVKISLSVHLEGKDCLLVPGIGLARQDVGDGKQCAFTRTSGSSPCGQRIGSFAYHGATAEEYDSTSKCAWNRNRTSSSTTGEIWSD